MSKKMYILIGMVMLFTVSCKTDPMMDHDGDDEHESSTSVVYPMYLDNNSNSINDYVEEETHWAVNKTAQQDGSLSFDNQSSESVQTHAFVDENNNGICDDAEDGSPTWHGPGFVDEDEDGICDYWDSSSSRFNHHQGLRYVDLNENRINDYFEEDTHQGDGHEFVDQNNDGICDDAQNGSPTWHGPGFIDSDHNGIHDHWQPGGHGYGHHN
jgi:hypothetical protein